MSCEYCGRTFTHASRCPLYEPLTLSNVKCDYCGEHIADGEEYIENDDGCYLHYECVPTIQYLVEWIGYEVKTLDIEDYKHVE